MVKVDFDSIFASADFGDILAKNGRHEQPYQNCIAPLSDCHLPAKFRPVDLSSALHALSNNPAHKWRTATIYHAGVIDQSLNNDLDTKNPFSKLLYPRRFEILVGDNLLVRSDTAWRNDAISNKSAMIIQGPLRFFWNGHELLNQSEQLHALLIDALRSENRLKEKSANEILANLTLGDFKDKKLDWGENDVQILVRDPEDRWFNVRLNSKGLATINWFDTQISYERGQLGGDPCNLKIHSLNYRELFQQLASEHGRIEIGDPAHTKFSATIKFLNQTISQIYRGIGFILSRKLQDKIS